MFYYPNKDGVMCASTNERFCRIKVRKLMHRGVVITKITFHYKPKFAKNPVLKTRIKV